MDESTNSNNIGALSTRVSASERGIRDLTEAFTNFARDLNAKLDAQISSGKTHWGQVLTVTAAMTGTLVGIMSMIGVLTIHPINDTLERHENLIVPRAELSVTLTDLSRRIETLETKVETRETHEEALRTDGMLRQDVRDIRSDLVTRSEHQTHWADIDSRETALSNRITSVQHDFGSSYTLGDQMKELQTQIRSIEQRLSALPK